MPTTFFEQALVKDPGMTWQDKKRFQFAVSQSASNSIQSIFIIPHGVIFCAASDQQVQPNMHCSIAPPSQLQPRETRILYSWCEPVTVFIQSPSTLMAPLLSKCFQ